MAHELEVKNGEASFFEVAAKHTAWHKLGTVLPSAPKSLDELKVVAPWLDYEIEKRPLFLHTDNGLTAARGSFMLYRPDNGAQFGVVGKTYTVTSHLDTFHYALEPMLASGLIRLETGGVIRDGETVWLLGAVAYDEMPAKARETFETLGLAPYVMVTVHHDGKRSNKMAFTAVRVVCNNTLTIAEHVMDSGTDAALKARVLHNVKAEEKTVEAATKVFGSVLHHADTVAAQYEALHAFTLDLSAFRSRVLAPALGAHPTRRPTFKADGKQSDAMVARYEGRARELTRLWEAGIGHAGDHSAWEAFNGVVEALDHNDRLFPTRSSARRVESLLDGEFRNVKERVLSALLDPTPALAFDPILVTAK